ncbi:MAG: carboxypeptidase-like regulatory domain-containing protein [Nonlabens sp.]
MKNFLFLLLLSTLPFVCNAKTITGTVKDMDGLPIFNAVVKVKGSADSTLTDFDGKYSIEAKETDFLIFSYTGYDSRAVKVGKQKVINVVMTSSLDEIVVTGYRKKSEMKSAISQVTITSENIQSNANRNYAQTLQGKTSGIRITTTNGSKVKTAT